MILRHGIHARHAGYRNTRNTRISIIVKMEFNSTVSKRWNTKAQAQGNGGIPGGFRRQGELVLFVNSVHVIGPPALITIDRYLIFCRGHPFLMMIIPLVHLGLPESASSDSSNLNHSFTAFTDHPISMITNLQP